MPGPNASINLEQLRADVRDRWIVATPGPDGLTLYNYSDQTVWDRHWTPETLAARGLVLTADGTVAARPWPKFFNVGETGFTLAELPAETPELSIKHDGSLIIVFWNPMGGRWQAVTRGSWDNEQTRFAQAWLAERGWEAPREFTYLFELCAPWNRIVLIYAEPRMYFLGRVENATGKDCSYAEAAALAQGLGITSTEFTVGPIDVAALANTAITDAEGFVVRYSNGVRVKLKYAEYLRLHKLLTGLSVIAIWEALAAGNTQPPPGVPDEFLAWWQGHHDALTASFKAVEDEARAVFAQTPQGASRKDIAAFYAQSKDMAPILFQMLDGREYAPMIWRRVRPSGAKTFARGEEG